MPPLTRLRYLPPEPVDALNWNTGALRTSDGTTALLVDPANPFDEHPLEAVAPVPATPDETRRAGLPVARWTGWLEGPAASGHGRDVSPHFPTLAGTGWNRLVTLIAGHQESRSADADPLVLRPHARHTLNDVPGCCRLIHELDASARLGVGLLIEPAAFLTGAMLDDADEHLERIFEVLIPYAQRQTLGFLGVLLSDVLPDEAAPDESGCPSLRPVPFSTPGGVLSSVLEARARALPAEVTLAAWEA